MDRTIYRFIFRHSMRQQIQLLVLTLTSFPFLYFSLDLPKTIINEAIDGSDFPRTIFGYTLGQVDYLLVLCTGFLLLVLVNGAFKYVINVYRGVVGERMLRRLRYALFGRVLRFPLQRFRRLSQGEIVAMITAETEPLGGYIGDSVALPAFQGGILLTIVAFMFVQDPVLGTAAVALYPVQGWFIPRLQRRVNRLKKERVVRVRKLSERIGEVVSGIETVHTHDTSHFELADFSARVGEIYEIRYQIYRQKFFIKFINNFLAQVTPFFFYSIGGYLVIRGSLSFGALVAVLAAYKDLASPWKELLNFYQQKEDARIKYELLLETFDPPGMLDQALQSADAPEVSLHGPLVATNVALDEEEEGESTFASGFTVSVDMPARLAVLGPADSGGDRFARVASGVQRAASGTLTLAGTDIPRAPEALTGRRIAYAGPNAYLRSGTLRDNLTYGLKHRPQRPPDYSPAAQAARDRALIEARLSGNSEHDPLADWVDYQSAGVAGAEEFGARAIEVLELVDMAHDVYQLGLKGTVEPDLRPEFAARLLEARAAVRERLTDPKLADSVELFRADAYNTNMTVAENLLFGTSRDASFDLANLGENPYVRKVLHEVGLMQEFVDIGRKVAELMVDLFADVEPGSDLFEQFAFISADDLPEFRALLGRTESARDDAMDAEDRRRLLSLPFRLIVARHRLGLIDDDLQRRVLEARGVLARGFGSGAPPIEFFDQGAINGGLSIQDNMLFGRPAYGKARSGRHIAELLAEVVDRTGLRRPIMEIGLDYDVGIGGSRLGAQQRRKLALAQCLIKRPDLLVLDGVTAGFDPHSEDGIVSRIAGEFRDRALIWVLQRASLAAHFDRVLLMEGGRVIEQGSYQSLADGSEAFRAFADRD